MQYNDSAELINLIEKLSKEMVPFHLLKMVSVPPDPSEGDVPNWVVWRAFDEHDEAILDAGQQKQDSGRFRPMQFSVGSTVTAANARKMVSNIAQHVT